MALLKPGYIASFFAHGVVITGAFAMHQPAPHVWKQVAVYVPAPKPKATPKKPAPPPMVEEEKKPPAPPPAAHNPKPKPLAEEAPKPLAPEQPVEHAAMNALPDFGISLSGADLGAGVGVAVPSGGDFAGDADEAGVDSKKRAAPVKEKVLKSGSSAGPGSSAGSCDEAPTKPKPKGFVQPQYTDDARAAEIEGRVRLKLTIDSQGNVTNVEVLSGLGHGLDQSAVAAAKRMHFTPSMLCGKPRNSSFVVSMRFVLGE